MKKNKPPYQGSLAVIWGKRVVLPPKEPFYSVLRWYLERNPKLGWYVGMLLFWGGYAVLFYLPFVYTIDNTGAYLAVVLILWPIVFVFFFVFVGYRPPLKKDWYRIRILKAEKGSLYGLLHHEKKNEPLFLPFHYQYFYKKVDAGESPGFQGFIICTDQKNQQFILSTSWEYLPENCKHATEITNIPEDWYRLLFLVCNANYLQRYLSVLTKLEANPKNS